MSLLSWEEYDKQFHLSEVLTHAARACVSSSTELPETFLASYFTERVNKDAIEWIRCATIFTSHGICLQFTIHLYVNVEIVATTRPIQFPESELLSYSAYCNENINNNSNLLLLQESLHDHAHKEQKEEEKQHQLQKNQSSRKNAKKDGSRDNTSKSKNGLHSADQERQRTEEVNKVHDYANLCTEVKTLIEQNLLCKLQTVKVSDQAQWDNLLSNCTCTIQGEHEQSSSNFKDFNGSKENDKKCEYSEKTRVQITLPVEVQKILSVMALQLAAQSRSMQLYEYIYSSTLKQIKDTQNNSINDTDNINHVNDENDSNNELEEETQIQLSDLLIPFFGRFVEYDTSTNANCVNVTNKNAHNGNSNSNNNDNTKSSISNNNVGNNSANPQHTSKGIVSFETLYIVVAPYKSHEYTEENKDNHALTNKTYVNNRLKTNESVINYEFLVKLQRAVELFKTRFGEVEVRADGALLYDNFENIIDAVNVAVELLEASGIQTGREVTLGICVNCPISTIEHVNVNVKGRTKGAKSTGDDKKKSKASYNTTNKEKKNDRATPELKKTMEQLNMNSEEEVDNINDNNKKTESVQQEEYYYNLFPNDVLVTGLQLTEYLTEQVENSNGLITIIVNSHNLNDNQGMCRLMRKVGNKVRLMCNIQEMETKDTLQASTQDNAEQDKERTNSSNNNNYINNSLFVHDYIARFESLPLVTQIVNQTITIMQQKYNLTSDISKVEHNVSALTEMAIGLQSTLIITGGICSNTIQEICTRYNEIVINERNKDSTTIKISQNKHLINSKMYKKSLQNHSSENDNVPEIKRKNEKRQKKTTR